MSITNKKWILKTRPVDLVKESDFEFIEEVLPEIVVERDNGYKAVRYEKIVALLIECIKEQQVQIDELKDV